MRPIDHKCRPKKLTCLQRCAMYDTAALAPDFCARGQEMTKFELRVSRDIQRVGQWDNGTAGQFCTRFGRICSKRDVCAILAPPCPPRQVAQTSDFQSIFGYF